MGDDQSALHGKRAPDRLVRIDGQDFEVGDAVDGQEVPAAEAGGRWNRLGWWVDGPGWPWVAGLVDVAGLAGGAAVAAIGSDARPDAAGLACLALFPAAGAGALALARRRFHRMDAGLLDDLGPIVQAVSVAAMLTGAAGALGRNELVHGRLVIRTWAFALVALVLGHFAIRLLRRGVRRHGAGGRRTLIVGAGPIGTRIASRLVAQPQYGLRPVGFLDWTPLPAVAAGARPAPILGSPRDLAKTLRTTGARHVVLAFPARPDRSLVPLLRTCHDMGIDVSVVPRLFEYTNDRMTYEPVGGLPLLALDADASRRRRLALKDALDRLVAAALLVALAPVLAAIALAVRMTTRGPVIFHQRRLGLGGGEFDLLKFCTMREQPASSSLVVPDPASDLAPGGVEDDDRRTAVGRFLRRTSFDELLQLVNVVRGDMSLVGPRPERPELVELYSDTFERYSDRLRMRPGITGLAQVRGLRGRTSLSERVELDNYYIEHWSFALDCKILLRTFIAAFRVPE